MGKYLLITDRNATLRVLKGDWNSSEANQLAEEATESGVILRAYLDVLRDVQEKGQLRASTIADFIKTKLLPLAKQKGFEDPDTYYISAAADKSLKKPDLS